MWSFRADRSMANIYSGHLWAVNFCYYSNFYAVFAALYMRSLSLWYHVIFYKTNVGRYMHGVSAKCDRQQNVLVWQSSCNCLVGLLYKNELSIRTMSNPVGTNSSMLFAQVLAVEHWQKRRPVRSWMELCGSTSQSCHGMLLYTLQRNIGHIPGAYS